MVQLLRPLAGYTLYDHKTNYSVRRELQTECILDKIDEYRRNWLLHLQRKPLNRIPLESYHYWPQGRRTIGRPKKRWREQLLLWRRNGSKGPVLDVYDDDDDDDNDDEMAAVHSQPLHISTLICSFPTWKQFIFLKRNATPNFAKKCIN